MSNEESESNKDRDDKIYKIKAGAFLSGMTFLSFLGGFGMTLGQSKKHEAKVSGAKNVASAADLHVAGTALATRALGWGTFYAVSGFSLLCFTVWKVMDVNNFQEFRMKMGRIFPKIPKSDSGGRTEFAGLTDLLQYIIDEDEKNKKLKQAKELTNSLK